MFLRPRRRSCSSSPTPTREQLMEEVQPFIAEFLCVRGLELSAEKTRVTAVEDGFDFLGQTIRKHRGKLIITPSKNCVLLGLVIFRCCGYLWNNAQIDTNKETSAITTATIASLFDRVDCTTPSLC